MNDTNVPTTFEIVFDLIGECDFETENNICAHLDTCPWIFHSGFRVEGTTMVVSELNDVRSRLDLYRQISADERS